MLGASPGRVWREIDLPIIGRAITVGAVFAFTISMGEFGATALIARIQVPPMPVAIYRLLGQPGISNFGQALAMSTLLMLVCAAGFLAIERFGGGVFLVEPLEWWACHRHAPTICHTTGNAPTSRSIWRVDVLPDGSKSEQALS